MGAPKIRLDDAFRNRLANSLIAPCPSTDRHTHRYLRPKLVATSTEVDIDRAVAEVRNDLWRQIDRMTTKAAPRKR